MDKFSQASASVLKALKTNGFKVKVKSESKTVDTYGMYSTTTTRRVDGSGSMIFGKERVLLIPAISFDPDMSCDVIINGQEYGIASVETTAPNGKAIYHALTLRG